MSHRPADPATVAESLHVQGDVHTKEIPGIVEHWSKLDTRLKAFRAGSVDLLLRVKERETPSQHLTLECKIDGRPAIISTSSSANFGQALNEVRDDLIRQLADDQHRHEPRNNRHLRDTLRHD